MQVRIPFTKTHLAELETLPEQRRREVQCGGSNASRTVQPRLDAVAAAVHRLARHVGAEPLRGRGVGIRASYHCWPTPCNRCGVGAVGTALDSRVGGRAVGVGRTRGTKIYGPTPGDNGLSAAALPFYDA